jgi:hypothetical protein
VTTLTPAMFAADLLTEVGAPVTSQNVGTLEDWFRAEGGAGPEWGIPGNVADYNPINVTETSGAAGYGYDPGTGKFYPGSRPTPGNDPPVAAFPDWNTGLQATADRLSEPFAASILSALRSNASESTVAAAVGASGWGTGSFAGSGGSSAPTNAIPGVPWSGPPTPAQATLTASVSTSGGTGPTILRSLDGILNAQGLAAANPFSDARVVIARGGVVLVGLITIGVGLVMMVRGLGDKVPPEVRQAARRLPVAAKAASALGAAA